jgi:hypothetical protein
MLLLRQGREWPSDHAANSLAGAWTTRLGRIKPYLLCTNLRV